MTEAAAEESADLPAEGGNTDGEEGDAHESPPDLLTREALRGAPPEIQHLVTSLMAYSGPVPSPIAKKVTSEHITRMLELQEKDSQRSFEHREKEAQREHVGANIDRLMSAGGFLVAVVFIGFLIIYLRDKPEVLAPVVSGVAGLFAGFVGGIGYSKAKQKPR